MRTVTLLEMEDCLAAIPAGTREIAVLTGAGMSAESGVPTFRGRDGLWRGMDPAEFFTPDALRADPALIWQMYDDLRCRIAAAPPDVLGISPSPRWRGGVISRGPHRISMACTSARAARRYTNYTARSGGCAARPAAMRRRISVPLYRHSLRVARAVRRSCARTSCSSRNPCRRAPSVRRWQRRNAAR